MMIQPLQPPQHLLRAAGGQRRQVIGAQKSVAVDMMKNLPVADGQLKCRDFWRAFETGKSGHPPILSRKN